jgi:hypothetical protein
MREVVEEVPQAETGIEKLQKGLFFIYLRIEMSEGLSGVFEEK